MNSFCCISGAIVWNCLYKVKDVGSCTYQLLMVTFVFQDIYCVLVLLVALNPVGFFSSLCPLLKSISTGTLENWLISSHIYCIITVPYCKANVYLLYRASLSHCIPLYPTTCILSYCTPLHSTVPTHWQYCIPLNATVRSTDKHCSVLFPHVPISQSTIMHKKRNAFLRPKFAFICFKNLLLLTRKKIGFFSLK